MAKIKNQDYINDAEAILADLESVDNLNRSSRAMVQQALVFLEQNDGRYAFDWARRAQFMHEFVLQQHIFLSKHTK